MQRNYGKQNNKNQVITIKKRTLQVFLSLLSEKRKILFELASMDPKPEPVVTYICGGCGQEGTAKLGDGIQCRACGYRVLFKKRTRKIVQHVAR
ncbi:hypothetical protein V6N13_032754 [Hibiscus sabdariffa]